MTQSKTGIQFIGEILRFVTPVLIGVFGYISITYLSSIDKRFERIDSQFSAFMLSYHAMDKRIDRLEYKIFNEH